jgi:hypothetical protein
MSQESVILSPSDLNRITQAINGLLANVTVIEGVCKGHTSDYSEPGKASMTTKDVTPEPENPPAYCSVCSAKINRQNPLSGHIDSPVPIKGFKNYSNKEGVYYFQYCGIDCSTKIWDEIGKRTSDLDKNPYAKPGEVITH